MSGHSSPERVTGNPVSNERGSSTRILLLLLFLVLAAAGYLYYFTDLIRPAKEAAKPAAVQSAQVKQPIPPRPEQPGGVTPAKPEAAKPPVGAVPPAPAAPAAKPVPPPAPVAKPAPPAPAAKSAAPAPAAKSAASAAVAKLAVPPVPAAKKEAARAKPVVKAEKAVKPRGDAYALLIGDFVPDKTFHAILAKLKKSGITPVKKSSVTAPEPMKRLFVAEFTAQDTAEAELQKLKKLTSDAFLVADNGTYTLYAGSYFTESRLDSELQRLGAKGVKPVVRKTQIAIKVTRLTAGSFASAEEARKEAQRLKKLGITAEVVKAGK